MNQQVRVILKKENQTFFALFFFKERQKSKFILSILRGEIPERYSIEINIPEANITHSQLPARLTASGAMGEGRRLIIVSKQRIISI